MFDQGTFGCMNFIIQQSDFTGVLKVITYRDYNGFVLQLEVYRFLKSNQYVLENIVKQNIINPTDSKLLDRVSSEKIHSCAVNYAEAKTLIEYLKNVINWARDNNHKLINLSILNKMNIVLSMDQLVQLYHVVDSFGKNYFILESMFLMMNKLGGESNRLSEGKVGNDKITNYIPTQTTVQEDVGQYVQNQKDLKPSNDIEILLEYCYHSNLKNLVIHYTLNYYQYITDNMVGVEVDENIIKVKTSNILPQSLSMDSKFFYSYIVSNNGIPLNMITTYANKLIQKVYFDESDVYRSTPVYLMITNLILLVYSLRYLIELYPQIFDLQFEEILGNVNDMQKRIIQHYCTRFLKNAGVKTHDNGKDYEFEFEVNDFNIYSQQEIKDDELIKKLSEEYSHIIPVSQEMFVKSVIGRLKEDSIESNLNEHYDFRFSNKKVIDVDNLIKSKEIKNKVKKSGFVDSKGTVDPISNDDITLTNYLDYEVLEENIITKPFKYIMDYAKQAGSVSLIDDLPKEILNLFPIITQEILTVDKLPESLDNTYDYYRIIIDNLPQPQSIRYTTILFIVFQIIIPYYYAFHKKTIFNDCLL